MTAILEKARAEGYAKGIARVNENYAQTREAEYYDAFYKGRCEAEAEAPSRFRWWLFGVVCGLIPLVWSLTQ